MAGFIQLQIYGLDYYYIDAHGLHSERCAKAADYSESNANNPTACRTQCVSLVRL
jgi:hypothetical protein